MARQILMTPGPTPVAESTLMRMALPVPHHRHPGFKQILHEVRHGLKYLFQTEQEVIILTSSGTGAMEGSIVNVLKKSDRVLVIQAGKFGERWSELCRSGLAPGGVQQNPKHSDYPMKKSDGEVPVLFHCSG